MPVHSAACILYVVTVLCFALLCMLQVKQLELRLEELDTTRRALNTTEQVGE